MKIKVVCKSVDEGGYEACSIIFPDCVGRGKTIGDTLINLKEAIEHHVEMKEKQIDKNADVHVFDLS